MSYKCLDCGNLFEEGEQQLWADKHGLDTPPYEQMSGCPLCGGDYEETTPCKICGFEQFDDDLNGGVCDECIDKYKHDADMCFKIGSNDTDKVELNCFLASVFDKEDIEKLLFRELKEREKYMKELLNYDYEKFVEADRGWFAERLLEELEKEKK